MQELNQLVDQRVNSDSVLASSPADVIVMWNIAAPIGVVASIQGCWRLRAPRARSRRGERGGAVLYGAVADQDDAVQAGGVVAELPHPRIVHRIE
jgi:hypothetical protein